MRNKGTRIAATVFLVQALMAGAISQAQGQAKPTPYPAMAPLAQYLMTDKASEIALARSAGPDSIASAAEVMVLEPQGYTTAVKGKNGFLCLVERSWGKPTDDPEFWNPTMRAPHCFNQQAAETFAPIYLMKTKLVLAGKSPKEIGKLVEGAFSRGELLPLAPDGMAYMMSRQQYLGDRDKSWHPHLMFFYKGNVAASWAANQPDSPVMAAEDPEEKVTILFVPVDTWSDKSPAPR